MNPNAAINIPEGHLQDAQGRLVPLALVKPLDLTRHQLVTNIVARAKELQAAMLDFKLWAMSEVGSLVELSGQEYGAKLGGQKGNVTLCTYDGSLKLQRAIQEHVIFDERLQVAKKLIDECIDEWSEGANEYLRVLVNDAFKTDAEGRVSTSRVLGLRRHNIPVDKWKRAMEAITDSLSVIGSKSYLRLYERVGDTEQFRAIPLDLASL